MGPVSAGETSLSDMRKVRAADVLQQAKGTGMFICSRLTLLRPRCSKSGDFLTPLPDWLSISQSSAQSVVNRPSFMWTALIVDGFYIFKIWARCTKHAVKHEHRVDWAPLARFHFRCLYCSLSAHTHTLRERSSSVPGPLRRLGGLMRSKRGEVTRREMETPGETRFNVTSGHVRHAPNQADAPAPKGHRVS